MNTFDLFIVILSALVAYKSLMVVFLEPVLLKLQASIFGGNGSSKNIEGSAISKNPLKTASTS